MEEIWKDYIYNYQISNLGNAKNKITGKILKLSVDGNGYLGCTVSMGRRGLFKRIRIHRAVAELFIDNLNNFKQVNHKDGNKKNNCYLNLEWCTSKENVQHAYDNKLRIPKYGEENIFSKLTKDNVKYIRNNYIPRNKEFGAKPLSKKFGVQIYTIRDVMAQRTWKE